jgi:hypothetical protein
MRGKNGPVGLVLLEHLGKDDPYKSIVVSNPLERKALKLLLNATQGSVEPETTLQELEELRGRLFPGRELLPSTDTSYTLPQPEHSKVNAQFCKEALGDWCREHIDQLNDVYTEPFSEKEIAELGNTRHWKQASVGSVSGRGSNRIRHFEFEDYADDFQIEVESTPDDASLVAIRLLPNE